jgi:hypothetical protein
LQYVAPAVFFSDASCICGDVILNQREVALLRRFQNVSFPCDARCGGGGSSDSGLRIVRRKSVKKQTARVPLSLELYFTVKP